MVKFQVRCLLLLCLISCNNAARLPIFFPAKVVGVKDGDTIEILYLGKSETVRLIDIDCPEKKQPFGAKAKQFTSSLCFGKTVQIKTDGKRDRYKRMLATVFVDDHNVNRELVRAGLAWHYKQYSRKKVFAELETEARKKRVGLWSEKNPVEPWLFRSKGRIGKR
jgi:micrococcal nuclease